jgi:hypothetical protein
MQKHQILKMTGVQLHHAPKLDFRPILSQLQRAESNYGKEHRRLVLLPQRQQPCLLIPTARIIPAFIINFYDDIAQDLEMMTPEMTLTATISREV